MNTNKQNIKGHQLVRVDVSQAAQYLIDALPDPVHQLDEIKDQTMQALEEEWNYVPDINAIYPYQVNVAYGEFSFWTICKIRTFKPDTMKAGWFIGILTPDEYGILLLAAIEERDAVMVDALGVDTESALKWTAHY